MREQRPRLSSWRLRRDLLRVSCTAPGWDGAAVAAYPCEAPFIARLESARVRLKEVSCCVSFSVGGGHGPFRGLEAPLALVLQSRPVGRPTQVGPRRLPGRASAAAQAYPTFAIRCHVQQNDGRQDRHDRSEEHTSELQSRGHLVCRLLLEKKKKCNKTRLL